MRNRTNVLLVMPGGLFNEVEQCCQALLARFLLKMTRDGGNAGMRLNACPVVVDGDPGAAVLKGDGTTYLDLRDQMQVLFEAARHEFPELCVVLTSHTDQHDEIQAAMSDVVSFYPRYMRGKHVVPHIEVAVLYPMPQVFIGPRQRLRLLTQELHQIAEVHS